MYGSFTLSLCIYGGWLICFHKHLARSAASRNSTFQNPNSRSEPFILFSILICAWRPNFTFFWICLLFIKPLWKSLIRWSRNFYCFFTVHSKTNNFQNRGRHLKFIIPKRGGIRLQRFLVTRRDTAYFQNFKPQIVDPNRSIWWIY